MRVDQPHRILFPAALILGVAIVPLKLLELHGGLPATLPYGWHGHEMLLGMATAIIAGYLLPARRPGLLAAMLLAWIVARLVVFLPDAHPLSLLAGLSLWPLMMGAVTARRFLKGAKTARNLVFVPILLGFLPAELLYAAGISGGLSGGVDAGLGLAAGFVLLILFTMGGRIIAAASSGAHQRMGRILRRAAQPRLEAAGLLTLSAMLAADIALPGDLAGGVLAALAAAIILLRLWHWQTWRLLRRADVALLHLGYLWLALGLAFKAWGQTVAVVPWAGALHPALIGGFGTLAMVMIMRTSLQRARQPVVMPGVGVVACGLLTLAALARAESVLTGHMAAMAMSAAAWSLALGLMLVWLLQTYVRAGRSRTGA